MANCNVLALSKTYFEKVLMRIKLILAYDGTDFFGSQIQKHTDKTVLGTLSHTLRQLGIDSMPIASGRTDSGVHATSQVCHLDLPQYWNDLKKLKTVLNKMLPCAIRIRHITQADKRFHARYDAKKRVYRYIISTKELSPFLCRYVTYIKEIDLDKIEQNIKLFEGKHDYAYFQKSGSNVKTTVRETTRTFAYKHKNYIILHFEANGFLRSQVRLMCGALLQLEAKQITAMLKKEKYFKIKPVPPQGLYLAKIKYEG